MKKRVLVFVLFYLLAGASLVAQPSENRQLDSFSKISVMEAVNVYLIPGSKESAKVQVDGIDLEDVLTDVSNGKLKIHLSKGNHRNIDVDVWVTYRSLEYISVNSAATVVTDGALKAEYLEIDASSAGDARLELDVENLRVDVSSSADVEVSGTATTQKVSVASAGRYNGYDLSSDEADVDASSAGSARINASKKIDARASSAGSIRYKGNPGKIYENESSGGSVKKSN